MSQALKLVLRFRGWATVRLPTEPDPPDEPRGASGFTFAYPGEPPLDRIIRLQPLDEPSLVRPGSPWGWGVYVYDAFVLDCLGAVTRRSELMGMRVQLHGSPTFENRNWLLTPPGWEPICPFDLAIEESQNAPLLRRSAPLDKADPHRPVWKQPLGKLLAQGAKDIYPERETVGSATGIWDALSVLRQREATLVSLMNLETDPVAKHVLGCRLEHVRLAIANPLERRTMVRFAVERFAITMEGADAVVDDVRAPKGLSLTAPWLADFWAGAWDFDLLAMFVSGSLQIPFENKASDVISL
jgi:hypothetical protein